MYLKIEYFIFYDENLYYFEFLSNNFKFNL